MQIWSGEPLRLLRFLGSDLCIAVVVIGTGDAFLALRLAGQIEGRFQPFPLSNYRGDAETACLLSGFKSVPALSETSALELRELRSLIESRSNSQERQKKNGDSRLSVSFRRLHELARPVEHTSFR